jgi:hypothetical protein
MYKKSLLTDSYREASALMIGIIPHIPFVKSLATPIPMFDLFVKSDCVRTQGCESSAVTHQPIVPTEIVEPVAQPNRKGC